MRSNLNIKIKGSHIWKLCALVGLGIFLTCCLTEITNVDQPIVANAGDIIPITTRDSVLTNIDGGPDVANFVFGILMPTGWNAAANTTVSYTSNLGDGNMELMPSTTIEPANGNNLNYPEAMAAKFKIGANLVNDVQWVVFQSVQQITIPNGITLLGNINIKIKVGADGNTTIVKPAYVICETIDGLSEDTYWNSAPIYSFVNGPRLTVNSPTGDIIDLCDPQLTSFDPPKSLQNDYVTLSYNNKLDTTVLKDETNLYLCVDSAYTSDGKVLTGFCNQNAQSQLVQTAPNSGLFKLTFWPSSFLGLSSTQTLTKILYHITDAAGNKVGLNNSSTAFTYKFQCN